MSRHIQPIFQSWKEREIHLLLSWAFFQRRYQARQKKKIIYKKKTPEQKNKRKRKKVPNPPVSSARFLSPYLQAA
jgi:hypothetical protein